nr:hypothetical protein [Tanacetum cinerariifolium]
KVSLIQSSSNKPFQASHNPSCLEHLVNGLHLQILILVLNILALVLRTLTLVLHIPQDCIVSFDVAFKINVGNILCLRNRSLAGGSTALTRAGVEDETGAEDWFFLSKSNALTKSLSSATSDETAGVEELVPTLATTALARD